MSEEQRKILEMLGHSKITVDEAESLLEAIADTTDSESSATLRDRSRQSAKPRYLRVHVAGEGDAADKVNIRVPLRLLRAGMKLANIIPETAQKAVNSKLKERGIKLDISSPGIAEELLANLCDISVNVGSDNGESVRVYCE